MAKSKVGYLVFDVESISDGELIATVRYPDEPLDAAEAVARYRGEMMERHGTDFIPYTNQIPVSVVVAKVNNDYRLEDIVVLDEPAYRPHVITDHFWRGWEAYGRPTLVSFNGRSFDLPLLELAAFRYGLSLPGWFVESSRSWDQPRNRYNTAAHIDLQDILINFGATRFSGGLNLAATLLGKPGKMEVQGHMVQDMYGEGRIDEINDYCRCDVLDTYFVFLRSRVLIGALNIHQEQQMVAATKEWLLERAEDSAAYSAYLDQWQDWPNPWSAEAAEAVATAAANR